MVVWWSWEDPAGWASVGKAFAWGDPRQRFCSTHANPDRHTPSLAEEGIFTSGATSVTSFTLFSCGAPARALSSGTTCSSALDSARPSLRPWGWAGGLAAPHSFPGRAAGFISSATAPSRVSSSWGWKRCWHHDHRTTHTRTEILFMEHFQLHFNDLSSASGTFAFPICTSELVTEWKAQGVLGWRIRVYKIGWWKGLLKLQLKGYTTRFKNWELKGFYGLISLSGNSSEDEHVGMACWESEMVLPQQMVVRREMCCCAEKSLPIG